MMKSLIDQVFGRLNLFGFGDFHGGSRNYVRLREHGIVQSTAERVFHDQLLQLKIGFGHRQGLLVRGHRALRTHRFNGRKAPDLHLFLRVRQCLLGEG